MELGQTLGNISEACRKLGVSRQHYYDIKQAIEEEGLEGLLEKSLPGASRGQVPVGVYRQPDTPFLDLLYNLRGRLMMLKAASR